MLFIYLHLLTRFIRFQQQAIRTQLPYDALPGRAELELEDGRGLKTVIPVGVGAVQPAVRGFQGAAIGQPFIRQTGEEFTLRLSGLGAMNGEAPWGAVPTGPLTPAVPIAAFVGGRTARILSAELSLTEVGIVEIRIEVPSIGDAVHTVGPRIGELDVLAGYVQVTAPSR